MTLFPLKTASGSCILYYFFTLSVCECSTFSFINGVFKLKSSKSLQKHVFLKSYRSCHWRYSVNKDVLKSFTNFTEKHLWWCLFLMKLQAFRVATLLNILKHTWFSYEIHKILKNICEWLLLELYWNFYDRISFQQIFSNKWKQKHTWHLLQCKKWLWSNKKFIKFTSNSTENRQKVQKT